MVRVMSADVVPLRPFTIGGSEAAAACGVDPYCSPVMLWARKTGKLPPVAESEAMLWGTLIEPLILDVIGRHGYSVGMAPGEDVWRDESRPWLVGHPDSLAYHEEQDRHLVVDAKTTGPWNAHLWDDDSAPTSYIVQLQVYMHLTGVDHGLLACLIAGQRLMLRTVERDQRTIDLILAGLDAFHDCIVRDEPPPPQGTESDAEALRGMFPGEAGKRVRLDRAGMALVHEYRERKAQADVCKRQADVLKEAIQLRMGDAEIAVNLSDEVVAKWTTYLRQGQPSRRFTVV